MLRNNALGAEDHYSLDKTFEAALTNGYPRMSQKLLGLSPGLAKGYTNQGWSIHIAVQLDRVDLVGMLLNAGASPNVEDSDNYQTALDRAECRGNTAIAQMIRNDGGLRYAEYHFPLLALGQSVPLRIAP